MRVSFDSGYCFAYRLSAIAATAYHQLQFSEHFFCDCAFSKFILRSYYFLSVRRIFWQEIDRS